MAKRQRKKPENKKLNRYKNLVASMKLDNDYLLKTISRERDNTVEIRKKYDQVVNKITQIEPYSTLLPPKIKQCDYVPYRVAYIKLKFEGVVNVDCFKSVEHTEEEPHYHIMNFLDIEFQDHPESQSIHFIARIQNEDGTVKSGVYAHPATHIDRYKVNYLAERIAQRLKNYLNKQDRRTEE